MAGAMFENGWEGERRDLDSITLGGMTFYTESRSRRWIARFDDDDGIKTS